MSFFEDASLVLIPSAQKTSKVYSVKPTDGTGDLTFTRSNATATRVASNGLIEKVRTNLLTYSEDFTSARGWSVIGGSVTATANYGTAPDGTNTSTRIVFSAASEIWAKSVTGVTGIGVFSLYIKGTAGQTILITYGGTLDKTITLGSGWNRFSTDGNSAASTQVFINTYGGATARDFEVWGGQVELGDIATDYIATTTAAVSVGPVANVPRLDYLNSSCPRLLLEPQRTNLVNYSEQLNNAYWLNSGLSLSANSVTSPDGYVNADTATETATTSQHGLSSGVISFTNGTTYTFSAFAKNAPSGRGFIQLYGFQLGSGAANVFANFDLNTGVVGSLSGGTSTITNYGNGWYRCTFTFACGNSLSERINLFNVTSASATAGLTYAGDITKAIYWYGAQVEAGAYATSYIPTLGAAVTRGADVALKSGISSLIGQTSGSGQITFTMDADTSVDVTVMLGLHAGESTANRVQVYSRFGLVYLFISANNTILYNDWVVDPSAGDVVNIAFKYGSFGFVGYANGSQVVNITTPVVFTETLEMVTIGNRSGVSDFGKGQRVSQALVFPTALSNSDLAALTA